EQRGRSSVLRRSSWFTVEYRDSIRCAGDSFARQPRASVGNGLSTVPLPAGIATQRDGLKTVPYCKAIWCLRLARVDFTPAVIDQVVVALHRVLEFPRFARRVSASPNRSSVIPIRSMIPRYRLHNLRFS